MLVSLMEDFEYDLLKIADLVPEATARGICVHRFPIVDGSAPRDEEMEAFLRLVRQIEQAAMSGEVVVIHCRGGLGRAGTVAASFLVMRGHTATGAIAAVRAARSPAAVESIPQEAWIARVALALRSEGDSEGTRL
jgi:ADP-ribosyl-[dinitrogen reductase] hydrolase